MRKSYEFDQLTSVRTAKLICNYYLYRQNYEKETISEIANRLGYSESTIRRFINSIDTSKNINGEFSDLYKSILLYTKFRTNSVHYTDQRELESKVKYEKVKKLVRSIYYERKEK